jgi:hypothetical protein
MLTSPRNAKRAVAVAQPADAGDERRRRMLAWMQRHGSAISGNELAERFEVSRQCVVQDIAILRAAGTEIVATPRGYRLPKPSPHEHREILACNHPAERTEEELQVLVDHGVKVLDVIVEHPLYGELRGSLMIESRADVQDFLERMRARNASLLSSLTGGVHLHTVEARRADIVTRAKAELRERGILLK